jgi:hypothetical protein
MSVEGVDHETIELTNQNDTSILPMQSKLQDKNDQQDHNQRLLSQVKLLQLLDNCNAPLHLFDDIIWWTREASIIPNYDFEQTEPSWRFIAKDLIQRNTLVPLLPKVIQFKLPKAKQEVKVITHNVTAATHSLLSDEEHKKAENLVFCDNPLENPNSYYKSMIMDVNDGSCYKNACTYYCSNKEKGILCPLILFIDKTQLMQREALHLSLFV